MHKLVIGQLYLLTFYPCSWSPYLFNWTHVLDKLKMSHIVFYHLPPIILWSTSTSHRLKYIQPLTPPHWGIQTSFLHVPKPSQHLFSQLVHHGGDSHFVSHILIPIPIAPSIASIELKSEVESKFNTSNFLSSYILATVYKPCSFINVGEIFYASNT